MKTTLLSVLFFIIGLGVTAQVPQGFNYQAIARNSANEPIAGATIKVKLSILNDSTGFYFGTNPPASYVWEEEHLNVKTNAFGLFTVVLGTGTRVQGVGSFSSIVWQPGPYFIGTKVANPTTYKIMGAAKLWSVPYALVSAKADVSAKTDGISTGKAVAVVSSNDASTEPLFEVRRADGQQVFVVYPDAVNVFVPPASKGGAKGGFAIGGFNESKGPVQDLFRVTPDSVRVYINDNPTSKGSKGGFAIGGFNESKAGPSLVRNYFMNVVGATTMDTVKGSPQILWFPNKNAFFAGNVQILWADSVGKYSTALGYRSKAMGDYSQAFGYRAKAFGDYSTSIGKNSVAGTRTGAGRGTSLASNAFAFGNAALAYGNGSFAFGNSSKTTSTGTDSYAFGSGAEASGIKSFAFGSASLDSVTLLPTSTPTKASGNYSTAIGMGAQAKTTAAFAFGVGAIAEGSNSVALGSYVTASGPYSLAQGYRATTTVSGYYSTSIGYLSSAGNYYAHAFGFKANAGGRGSLSMGYYSSTPNDYSTAIGYYARTYANYATAFGNYAYATGVSSMALGYSADATKQYSVALGYNAQATGDYSLALGFNPTSSGNNSTAMGYQSMSSGIYSTAIGYLAKSTVENSYSFGYKAEATGINSFAIGTMGIDDAGNPNTTPTKTTANYSLAMGMGTQATALGTVGIGVNSTASGERSVAIGYKALASAPFATSFGSGTNAAATASYSTAIGYEAYTEGTLSTAIGYRAKAYGAKSVSIGAYYNYTGYRFVYDPVTRKFKLIPYTVTRYNTATDEYSIAFGNGNTATKGGLAIGTNNYARAFNAVALGFENYADSAYSVAIGSSSRASGLNAVAIGESVTAQASNSFVVGYNNIISGTKDEWISTDPLFVIGNGGSGTASNAVVVSKNGNTTINGNLTVTGSIAGTVPAGSVVWNSIATQNIRMSNYWLSNDGGSEGVFVGTTGLVGIGDASPSYNLDVAGSMRATSSLYANSNLYVTNYASIGNGLGVTGDITGTTINNANNANLTVDAGTLHIDGTNNRVGINNTTPAYGLDVTGNMSVSSTGRFGGDVTVTSTSPGLILTDSDGDDFRFEANGGGLSILSNGTYKETVLVLGSNGVVAMPTLRAGSKIALSIEGTTGELLRATSSMRYKNHIVPLEDISWLYNLKPVSFFYNDDPLNVQQYGLVAEEVEKINPSLVVYDKDNRPDGLVYDNLISVLIKASQNQKMTIESLKSENADLRERLEKLESIVSTLAGEKK